MTAAPTSAVGSSKPSRDTCTSGMGGTSTEGAQDLASQIAARGCGSQAVYVFIPDTNTWVLNGPVLTADLEGDDDAEGAEAVQTLVV